MSLSEKQIRRIVREQLAAQLDDVEAKELDADEQADGVEDPIDYAKVGSGESNESEPEVMEIVEKLKRRMRLKRIIREQAAAAAAQGEEELPPPPPADEPEERAGATVSSLRAFFTDHAAMAGDLGISDPQIPALVAAMKDLIAQAQAGQLASREDRVRKSMAKA
tara:strand:- start:2263 stop:2757 length:495 start_codon:yes stop_codon:yes gene_type:complete